MENEIFSMVEEGFNDHVLSLRVNRGWWVFACLLAFLRAATSHLYIIVEGREVHSVKVKWNKPLILRMF